MDPLTGAKLWLLIKPIRLVKKALNPRRIRKGKEPFNVGNEDEEMLKALKSKTVWFGILTSVWGVVQVFLQAGDFSTEAIVSLISGIVIIILRALTTQPLSAK